MRIKHYPCMNLVFCSPDSATKPEMAINIVEVTIMKLVVFAMLLAGCGSLPEPMDSSMGVDASIEDGGVVSLDSGLVPGPDTGTVDASGLDAGVSRDGGVDAGTRDAGFDSGTLDSGSDSGAPPPVRLEPAEISTAGDIFCARDIAGSTWCWDFPPYPRFVGMEYMGSYTSLGGMCGIRSDGTVACFGPGGVVISIRTASGLLRAEILGAYSIQLRGCAISAGEVWCWESGLASRLPGGITGVVSVDAVGGCAVTPSHTWCWDGSAATATPIAWYSGGTYVHRGGDLGSGICVDRVGEGPWCNGGNRDCAYARSAEVTPGTFRPTGLYRTVYAIGTGVCRVNSGGGVSCYGPGAAFGGSSPCGGRGGYSTPPTEVRQLAASSREVCALLRPTPGPFTIECWGSGPPAPIGW